MKDTVCALIGIAGGGIANLFGGWSSGMTTLLLFMAADYVSGMLIAGVWHKSTKTKTGALESKAGFKGICRKGMMLLIILIAYRIDLVFDTNYIRNAVIIAFITNELISIVENAGLMGIPMPSAITKAIDLLQKKTGKEEEEKKDDEKS